MKPINGQRYRYSAKGEIRSHRGLIGVASQVANLTAVTWSCTLSNVKEWGEQGIATQITALGYELEPVEEMEPSPESLAQAKPTKTTEGRFVGMESDLVADITAAAQQRGYRVCKVGQHRANGSGTTVGYPDMSFHRPEWPRGMVCLIEVKTSEGTLTKEQEGLHTDGWSYVAYSVEEAMEALTAFRLSWSGRTL